MMKVMKLAILCLMLWFIGSQGDDEMEQWRKNSNAEELFPCANVT
jgi:hypothetical protein